jgi:hypothetical protein
MSPIIIPVVLTVLLVNGVLHKIAEHKEAKYEEEEVCEDNEYSSKDGLSDSKDALDDSKDALYSAKDSKGFTITEYNSMDPPIIFNFPPLPPPPPINICPKCVTDVDPPSHHEKRRN